MKIVIDIQDEIYNNYIDDRTHTTDILNAVIHGTPLPDAKIVNISDMMYEIYMEGVNMTGEYQGCWVRFKDIEKIVNKHIPERK